MVLSGNDEDDLQFRLRTDVGAVSKVTVPDGQDIEAGVWTHVAVVWDVNDPNMRFYKNGEEIHIAAKAGAAIGIGPDVEIGIGNQSVSAGPESMDRPFDGILVLTLFCTMNPARHNAKNGIALTTCIIPEKPTSAKQTWKGNFDREWLGAATVPIRPALRQRPTPLLDRRVSRLATR